MVVGVVLYILSTHELGPVWQSMVDRSTETMENVTGQSSDELMERGKGTMDALGNLVDDVMEGMK